MIAHYTLNEGALAAAEHFWPPADKMDILLALKNVTD